MDTQTDRDPRDSQRDKRYPGTYTDTGTLQITYGLTDAQMYQLNNSHRSIIGADMLTHTHQRLRGRHGHRDTPSRHTQVQGSVNMHTHTSQRPRGRHGHRDAPTQIQVQGSMNTHMYIHTHTHTGPQRPPETEDSPSPQSNRQLRRYPQPPTGSMQRQRWHLEKGPLPS